MSKGATIFCSVSASSMATADPPVTTQAERDRDSEIHKFPILYIIYKIRNSIEKFPTHRRKKKKKLAERGFRGGGGGIWGWRGTGATVSEISAGSIQNGKSDFTSFESKRHPEVGILRSENLTPRIPNSKHYALTLGHQPVTYMTVVMHSQL